MSVQILSAERNHSSLFPKYATDDIDASVSSLLRCFVFVIFYEFAYGFNVQFCSDFVIIIAPR